MERNLSERELKCIAARARLLALDAIYTASSGHPGGSFSCMDALTALYFDEMNIKPENPQWEDRDRFVLSKGHCAPALYSTLALRGYFPVSQLKLLRSIEGHMSGHPDMRHIPGVDMSTGSLGQGLSAAVGMAIAARLLGKKYRTYVICGDGEIEEGQIWEALMAAAKWKLSNLCLFIDVNGLQIDGKTADVMPTEPIDAKLGAFGWNTLIIDGHSFEEIRYSLKKAREASDKPTAIIMHTVKGKDVSFMENQAGWHGKAPNAEQFEAAKAELTAKLKVLEG